MTAWTLNPRRPEPSVGGVTSAVFIDAGVENASLLIRGTRSGVKTEIVSLQEDGVAFISASLAGCRHLAAVHIVSLGDPGCVYLGNSQLCLDTLDRYRGQLEGWGNALAKNADILFYGSRVAANPPANDSPHPLLDRLHQLTRANIAASATFTGNVRLGGSWQLETHIGQVSAIPPFRPEVMRSYTALLNDGTTTQVLLAKRERKRSPQVESWRELLANRRSA